MRDRLIELLKMYPCMSTADMDIVDKSKQIFMDIIAEDLADYLIDNGVIVPPCKVGDAVYYISGIHGKIVKEARVEEIYYNGESFAYRVNSDYLNFDLMPNEVCFSREEAEKALKGKEDEEE